MSKAVLMSIRPEWCELIASGKKTIEVRKNMPREFVHDRFYGGYITEPFKVYIYETTGHTATPWMDEDGHMIFQGRGEVIGEFVCDRIREEPEVADGLVDVCLMMTSCMNASEIIKYANGKMVYSWHISDLMIYDKPKALSEFKRCDECPYGPLEKCWNHEYGCDGEYNVRRAPQSWCYVEYVGEV